MSSLLRRTCGPLVLVLVACSGGGAGTSSPSGVDGSEDGASDGADGASEDADGSESPPDAGASEGGDAGLDAGTPLPAYLTTVDRRIVPSHALESADGDNPAPVANVRDTYLSEGYGAYAWGPGSAYVARTVDDAPVPAWGPMPRRLTRFAHLSDLQLADDESLTRVGNTDTAGATSGALRTQDPYLCHMANAAVRAINQLDARDPIAFTLLGGDNVDNAQPNELEWLVGILDGGEVECDSGADDDLTPGPANDPKDPLATEGLAMPWLWVSGNHDELVQGNLAVSGTFKSLAAGGTSPPLVGGTRDYTAWGDSRTGSGFPSDSRRSPMTAAELMVRLADTDDGHGIGAQQVTRGKAFHHYDIPDAPIRLVIMDTAAETGGASGMLRQADLDEFVIPAIEEARDLGRFVILASHHAIDALTSDGGTFGSAQDGALLPDDFRAVIGAYDHVLFSLVGHSHVLDVQPIATPQGRSYWQVMTAAIADYPHELRTIELWDGDNGYYMLRATAVDIDTEGDALAEQGRVYGLVDYTTGWSAVGEQPTAERVNVELWIQKPEGLP